MMMKNKTKIQNTNKYKKAGILALSLMVMSTCLAGCTLAKPEQQQMQEKDEFIGVLVTLEEDIKDYMMQEGDTLYYEEKKLVRADGSTTKLTDEQIEGFNVNFAVEGVKQKDGTYQFGDVDGYYIGYSKEIENEGTPEEATAVANLYTDGVYDVGINLGSNSTESNVESVIVTEGEDESEALDLAFDKRMESADESTTVSGTVSVSSQTGGQVQTHQVFKRGDGSVYAVIPGSSGMMVQKGSNLGSWTHTISESYETSLTGTGVKKNSKKLTVGFEVTVEARDLLESAIIKQMDSGDREIKASSADFSTKDSTLKLEANTSYVIIEENFIDEEGQPYLKRTTYDCERLGKTYESGYEVNPEHSFYITKENGKFGIVRLSFKR